MGQWHDSVHNVEQGKIRVVQTESKSPYLNLEVYSPRENPNIRYQLDDRIQVEA